MNSLKIVLLGIAIILFGGACLALYETAGMDGVLMEGLGLFSPFVGVIVAIFGVFVKD